ncbi:hypothetical protein GSI_06300 [Ganoderma sinense ZZ0214-1]|uniref:RlpA-like protein double-psi beta-barrel domain-containing protein n=1 Tax=Ganoderma sinense ZZ0214-1 TaxID=1077348 RepID=A0A2G8SDD1_9APHY|nr:hypothetical protein GSI_06300 [Ganoderma sinense ZZ0214-1]
MYFSKAIVVLSAALSAMASPHMARGVHHRELACRAAMPSIPEAAAVPEQNLKMLKKRASTNRCRVRSTTAAATSTSVSSSHSSSATHSSSAARVTSSASSSSIIPPQNVESTTAAPQPTSTKVARPTTTKVRPTTTPRPSTTQKTTTAAAPTTSASSGSSASDPLGILTGTHSGDGTYYSTGLGSCGITNSDSDKIVAVSHLLYDQYPGYTGGNPNNNPLCKRMIRATYQGKSVEVMAVDRCTGCAMFDLDFSPSAFSELADFAIGRLHGVEWEWI